MKIYPQLDPRKDQNRNHAIKILIRKDGGRKQFNTGYRIKKSHWDGSKVKTLNADHATINATLQNTIKSSIQYIAEKPNCTAAEILQYIKTRRVHNETILIDYGKRYRENYTDPGTINSIKSAIRAVDIFKPGVRVTDIDRKFIDQFVLKSKLTKTDKTIHNYLSLIQKMLDFAVMDGIIKDNPLKGYKKPSPRTTRERQWLTFEEQRKLINSSFDDHKLQLSRDVFVFQMLLDGIRVSNALLMERSNIKEINGDKNLVFTEIKMKRLQKRKTVYISSYIQEIIDRWETPNRFIFPLLPDNYYKQTPAQQKSRLQHRTGLINKGLVKVMDKLKINKKITTHSARHTIAHTADELGLSLLEISQMLNHGTVAMTGNYMRGFRAHNNKKFIKQLEEKLKQNNN